MTPKKFQATAEEIAEAQRDFDFLIPFQTRALLTTPEVATILRRTDQFVRDLVESGQLESHQMSGAVESRLSNRITRRSLCVLLSRSANYETRDLLPGIKDAIATLPPDFREELTLSLLAGCSLRTLTRIITRAQALKDNS